MNAPKFEAGKVYHLSHSSGMPADIYIEMVYMKPKSTEWMYIIRSEATNCDIAYVPESSLLSRITLRTSKVYKANKVISLINEGFRFAGNVEDLDSARIRGKEFAKNCNIHDVMIYNALDQNGDETGGYGIWIRWNVVIDEKYNGDSIPIKIK